LVLVALLAVVVLVAAGCGSDDKKSDDGKSSSTTASTEAKKKDEPTVTVTPSEGLTDGQKVHVTGKGFVAGHKVAINECSENTDDTGSGCDLGGLVQLDVAADGSVEGDFNVKVGPFGKDNIVCKAKGPEPCLLSVGELVGDAPHPTQSITFAG
jgi:hypothetical protein